MKRLAFKIPATTTAIIPETWTSSARKKVTRGKLNSNKSSLAISVARTLSKKVWRKRLVMAVKNPIKKPPRIEKMSELLACPREKAPVVQAVKAT
ncbi:Uncharacterised protein [Streptococcus pneumoniae]|nr:Uncharacterised protein [Streptococcus pneumoniae]CJD97187.1 Uncharacterised protein [Streptococcus pneumoniae]CJG16489.1 Uncharacterised protein [Streptococcus pneumoniae]COH32197.1 Uncharacterised protein [Streptococcus pneumoniae]COJ79826.1 Uncharacterised protein [Streptococcus pneumoniae]